MPNSESPQQLPVVVSLGFAGSRNLLDPDSSLKGESKAGYLALIEARLSERLAGLPQRLKLKPHHFLCGISQIAIGADALFTKACADLSIAQRIFLPQARDEYLAAGNSDNTPDFSPEEKAAALQLLDSPHIIHERVVSHSQDRTCRFEDTNLEILRASEVIICLLRAGGQGKRGGTSELLEYGKALGKPVLEIQVREVEGEPEFTEQWHLPENWCPPELPEDLRQMGAVISEALPSPGIPISAVEYLKVIKKLGSDAADWKQRAFKYTAFVVIGAHLLATLCAVAALKMSGKAEMEAMVSTLLLIELLLLVTGFGVHFWLHHSHMVRVWAICRLSAEIARSVGSLRGLHVHLEYLFKLPFPDVLKPFLRTVNVLYLASTKASAEPWQQKREHYVASRLDGNHGQMAYYRHKYHHARGRLKMATWIFNGATVSAFFATACKLLLHPADGTTAVLGTCAIVLPVLAVAALSLAASFDLEARAHTYHETYEYLKKVRPLFAVAKSERAFTHLMLQTEARLLGETANWASRRSFTGVT